MESVSFSRPAGEVVRTALLTFLVAPIAGLVLGAFVCAVVWSALPKSFSKEAVQVTAVAAGCLAGFSIVWKGWREMRHFAGCEVRIHDDQVVRRDGDRVNVMKVDEVDEVRLRWAIGEYEVRLASRGRTLVLPVDIAPFSAARAALETGPLEKIAHRFAQAGTGSQGIVRERPLSSLLLLLLAVSLPLFGTLLVLTIHGAGEGFRLVRLAVVAWRLGWRGLTGGFRMTKEGLVTSELSASGPIRWHALRSIESSDYGYVVRATDGRRASCSWLAVNAWPAMCTIRGHLAGSSVRAS